VNKLVLAARVLFVLIQKVINSVTLDRNTAELGLSIATFARRQRHAVSSNVSSEDMVSILIILKLKVEILDYLVGCLSLSLIGFHLNVHFVFLYLQIFDDDDVFISTRASIEQ
jgi:hypothetical protein